MNLIWIYINLSIFMFLSGLMFMFLLLFFLLFKLEFYMEFNMVEFNSLNVSIVMYFDYFMLLFMFIISIISSMIILYSIEYMMFDLNSIRFIYMMLMFIVSMMFMIVGQNLLLILLGWDGLGLISYCLVIYYNSWKSFNSGMLTVLTNRLGDVGLMIVLGMFSMMGNWNYLFIVLDKNLNLMFMNLMILLMVCTKSAQIPFSCWLPEAMAAPTPISSLVHSSTLVTAGVYMFMRLINLMSILMMKLLFLISLMTMFMSGLVAMFEYDFKKIIALSTLSQLGMMMLSMSVSLVDLGFFHLIIHAMFKSLLFMCVGLMLHKMMNNQDIRFMGNLNFNFMFTLVFFNSSNLSLCGFMFMSGFFSKDLILEMIIMCNNNFMLLLMFYISIGFTVGYSFRLIYYMMMNYMKYNSLISMSDNYLMNFSMIFMYLFSIMGGSMYSWLFYSMMDIINLFNLYKYMIYVVLILSLMMSLLMNYFLKVLMNFNMFMLFMKNMWLLSFLSNLLIKNFLFSSMIIYLHLEKGWLNYLGKLSLKFMIVNLVKINVLYNSLIFIMLLMFIILMLYMF